MENKGKNEIVLKVLETINYYNLKEKSGKTKHLLGKINDVPTSIEYETFQELHKKKIINVLSVTCSNNRHLFIEDDYRLYPYIFSISRDLPHGLPQILELTINKKKVQKEIELLTKKTEKNEKISLLLPNLPTGLKWDDVQMKFENEFDIVIYIKKKFYKKISNVEMGFFRGKTKSKLPTREWCFLLLLSVIQEQKENEATAERMAVTLSSYTDSQINKNNCEKIKSKLSYKLNDLFGISEDPFFRYSNLGYYKTKFQLKPIPSIRGKGEIYIPPRDDFIEDQDFEKL
jgi:hypothetical protein